MGNHASISGAEAADRLEIQELLDAYAHCADRRDAKGQMSFFYQEHTLPLYSWTLDPINRQWN
jgi:hypothetical protein